MPRIVHIAIKVDDLEKATKFYEEVFRFRQTSTGYALSSETGKRRFASDCVVVDAAPIEPVSTGQFPSIREKNREFCKFEGIATTCPRANTRHFRRFSAKFPVRIEPGILLSNREFFLSNRETFKCENGKSARSQCLRVVSPR
jgi:catechol 2,3-dioxygenase-like lactoylglutathione lyase family enzyme